MMTFILSQIIRKKKFIKNRNVKKAIEEIILKNNILDLSFINERYAREEMKENCCLYEYLN